MKIEWGILLFNFLYIALFAIHFFNRGNFEFIWYIFIMLILIGVFGFLHKKYKFNTATLIGLTLWGIGHMFGGSTLITEQRLYTQILIPLFNSGEVTILSYDHLMHFYFYVVMTSVIYQIIKKNIKSKIKWFPLAVFIFFASIGVGAFNEIVEFMPVLFLTETGVGGYYNIAWDLVFNALGALTTLIYISFRRSSKI